MKNPQNNLYHPNFERKHPQVLTLLCETQTLFERLKKAGILHQMEAKTVNTLAKWYDPNSVVFIIQELLDMIPINLSLSDKKSKI